MYGAGWKRIRPFEDSMTYEAEKWLAESVTDRRRQVRIGDSGAG